MRLNPMSNKAKLIAMSSLILLTSTVFAGVDDGEYNDQYTTRSEEVGRYDRIFAAGKAAGKTVVIKNNIIQKAPTPDLSNHLALQHRQQLQDKREAAKYQETMKSGESTNPNQKDELKTVFTPAPKTFTSSLGMAPVKVNVFDPDEVKNEWMDQSFTAKQATTISGITTKMMPVGWRVDVMYKDRTDQNQKYEFAVSDTRDGALSELLKDTGYVHKYFFNNKDGSGKALPLLIIHPEGE